MFITDYKRVLIVSVVYLNIHTHTIYVYIRENNTVLKYFILTLRIMLISLILYFRVKTIYVPNDFEYSICYCR